MQVGVFGMVGRINADTCLGDEQSVNVMTVLEADWGQFVYEGWQSLSPNDCKIFWQIILAMIDCTYPGMGGAWASDDDVDWSLDVLKDGEGRDHT